jgi:DNA-directed RNA polymerase specialized sigma24 family protein
MIYRAGEDNSVGRAALSAVLQSYSSVMALYLERSLRVSAADAEDYVQGFITDKILERGLLAQAREKRGRFRALLLVSLRNYTLSKLRAENSQIRKPSARSAVDPETVAAPEAEDDNCFDSAWAQVLIARTLLNMKARCDEQNRPDIWGVFEGRVLNPVLEGKPPVSHKDLMASFHLSSETHASNLLVTAKRMFIRQLESHILEYETSQHGVSEEVADLKRILQHFGHG